MKSISLRSHDTVDCAVLFSLFFADKKKSRSRSYRTVIDGEDHIYEL